MKTFIRFFYGIYSLEINVTFIKINHTFAEKEKVKKKEMLEIG